jgi:SAM-dependent methyltransferase
VNYSYDEYERSYQRIEREGLTTWNQLHGAEGFEDFVNRPFLESALPQLGLPSPDRVDVLEYGCGTGPAACFLAERGYRVHAIDLSPTAIALAREFASQRALTIEFEVKDMCALAQEPPTRRYGLIVDSFCLQSIVTDRERSDLLIAVRERLHPSGFYLISTAMYDGRTYGSEECYDPVSGICELVIPAPADGRAAQDGDVCRDGVWYRSHRRHPTPAALRAELGRGGFTVIWQGGDVGGDLVCVGPGYAGTAPSLL